MLADERKAKGLSQKAMADLLGLPYSTYCEYENGRKSIPATVAEKIANILKKSVDSLFLPCRFTIGERTEIER